MSDSQLNLESMTESVAKAQDYIWGGATHRKNVNWEGGTSHILSEHGDK